MPNREITVGAGLPEATLGQKCCPRCGLEFDKPIPADEVPAVNFESAPKDTKVYARLCVPCGVLGCDGLLKFLQQVASHYFSPEEAARAIKAQVKLREEGIRREYETCAKTK